MATPSTPQPPDGDRSERSSLMYGDTDNKIIQGHRYDGIKEYDNPMPGWWVWIFVATVIFAGYYVLGIYVFDTVDTYEEDLAQAQQNLAEIREAYALANPTFEADAQSLAAYVEDQARIDAGATHFATYCAACHGNQGQGLIGPNLTDYYWIHGASTVDAFRVITNGVVEKGMTPWESILTPEERAETVAYIYGSLLGTDPPDPKAPEGEYIEPADVPALPPADATD